MEIGLAILLFVCMTALLYVVLSLKITRQVDLQMKEFYKTRIHTDIQEFYREMEGYAGLLEARIKQFKLLAERNEEVVRTHQAASAQTMPQTAEADPKAFEYEAPQLPMRRNGGNTKKSTPLKRAVKQAEPLRKATVDKSARHAPAKKTAPVTVAMTGKSKTAKPVAPPARPLPVKGAHEARPAMPRVAEPTRPAVAAQHFVPPAQPAYDEADDSAIAEELMKDLFAQDQVKLSAQSVANKPETAAPPVETAGERTMANFFSRIGKSVGPIVFGEKAAAAEVPKKAEPAKPALAAASSTKPVADFSEVLRRAEQIKAEKKAERERAEVEARAEFYAVSDTMSQATPRERMPSRAASGDTMSQALPRIAASAPEPAAARQSLAVKDLDQHTINFLIDSLKQENGYRKQALRALTENNIPLPEIARMSKIDIGELELMRQLGRF